MPRGHHLNRALRAGALMALVLPGSRAGPADGRTRRRAWREPPPKPRAGSRPAISRRRSGSTEARSSRAWCCSARSSGSTGATSRRARPSRARRPTCRTIRRRRSRSPPRQLQAGDAAQAVAVLEAHGGAVARPRDDARAGARVCLGRPARRGAAHAAAGRGRGARRPGGRVRDRRRVPVAEAGGRGRAAARDCHRAPPAGAHARARRARLARRGRVRAGRARAAAGARDRPEGRGAPTTTSGRWPRRTRRPAARRRRSPSSARSCGSRERTRSCSTSSA